MIMCPNGHENLDGLSQCRVCRMPLLDLRAEFASLANGLTGRMQMGRRSPNVLMVGLGTVGTGLVGICCRTHGNQNLDYSYLAVDTNQIESPAESDGFLRLKLGSSMPGAGTFCGIGEAVTRSDPHLVPTLRKAGLNHEDSNKIIFLVTGIGGGIGSAISVLVEKCRQLNPGCHTVALIVIPGKDESFHNQLNAYCGMSRLLANGGKPVPDLVIAVQYDRIKTFRGVGVTGQELSNDSLLAAFTDLLMRNISSQYMAEMVRINRSLGIKLVAPCLALGCSIEIFDNLTNILESAIAYPANNISKKTVRTCHLLLSVPISQSANFEEEVVNEQLWALVRRHLPNVKASSSSITYSNEQHDRIEATILLGGGSATSALFEDDDRFMGFKDELCRQISWQTYGLSEESVNLASKTITQYDNALKTGSERRGRKIPSSRASADSVL